MEIATRPRSRRWQRLAARLSALTAVMALCLMLPASLGLSQQVVTDRAMGETLSRGALVFARSVRTSDQLRVGDVITFPPPGVPGQAPVTRRVVSIDGSTVVTRGDARGADDPWVLDVEQVEPSLTVFAVPLVGYPQLVVPWLTSAALLGLVGLAALACVVLARRGASRDRLGTRTDAHDPTREIVA